MDQCGFTFGHLGAVDTSVFCPLKTKQAPFPLHFALQYSEDYIQVLCRTDIEIWYLFPRCR